MELACYAADGIVDESAILKLVKLLEDEDEEVRGWVVRALGRYAEQGAVDGAAVPKLVKLLEDEDEEVRSEAARALGSYAEKGAVDRAAPPKLAKLLEDEDMYVRKNAAWALDVYAKRFGVSREVLLRNPSKILDYFGEELGRLSRVYARVGVGDLSERFGMERGALLRFVEEMVLRGVLDARVDGEYVVFGSRAEPGVAERSAASSPPALRRPVAEPSVSEGFLAPPPIGGYTLREVIGETFFSVVYLAEARGGELVVVKLPKVLGYGTIDPALAEGLLKEAEVWSRLRHPNIVEVYDYGVTPIPHIVMEYMPGGSLRGRIGRLGLKEALRVFFGVAGAVSFAHLHGVVHRDLKPENILFTAEGVAKVTDWGLAKVMIEASKRSGGVFKGTLLYAAPEQVSRSFGGVDWRTDIYQLGAVLYELLTGRPPFPEEDPVRLVGLIAGGVVEPPSSVNPGVPEGVDGVVLRALARRKEDRYHSVDLMVEALRRVSP